LFLVTELPPLENAGMLVDPYDLSCGSTGGQCPESGPYSVPTRCYRGFCSLVEHSISPWSDGVGLVIQSSCDVPVDTRVIGPGKLRMRIYFYNNGTTDVLVSI